MELLAADQKLRAEADELLEGRALRSLLQEYAPISVVGSYALRLMVWRDLDLAMDAPSITVAEFFELGKRITDVLTPWKMFFTNNRNRESASDPAGLYWGIRLGDLSRGAWKIDLWAFESKQYHDKVQQCEGLARRLDDWNRLTILALKSQLWNHLQYRDQITSQDIYDAVLDAGVNSLDQFWDYVQRKKA